MRPARYDDREQVGIDCMPLRFDLPPLPTHQAWHDERKALAFIVRGVDARERVVMGRSLSECMQVFGVSIHGTTVGGASHRRASSGMVGALSWNLSACMHAPS